MRASLRGYFTRLALSLLAKDHALNLTNKIFGGLNSPAHLILTSYLRQIRGGEKANEYNNFETKDAHSTWIINIDCNEEFKPLVNALLNLASRLGGIGPGWRRPPHELTRTHCFRGSEFILSFNSQESLEEESLQQLIDRLQNIILNLAQEYSIPKLNTPSNEQGRIISIWRGKKDLWEEIVHRICRSDDPNRPDWCGSSTNHPSGYAIRQYEDHCLVTVFESPIESELERLRFKQDWCEKTSQNSLISIS